MTIERLEVKASITVTEEGAIEAIAWPFGSPDLTGDVIEKTAEIEAALPLPMLWHHDGNQAVGVWDRVEITERGIEAKGRLLINEVERAREVRALVMEGAARGISIGFVNRKSTVRRGGGRFLQSLSLREISVTPTPAHPGARVLSAKAASSATPKDTMENETTVAAPDNAAFEAAIAALEKKSMDRLDKIEARLNRPAVTTGANTENETAIERKAFDSYVRRGATHMSADEVKSLTRSVGGYLAPEEFRAELAKDIVEYSALRSVARVINTSAAMVKMPKRTGTMQGKWVGETETRTGTQPSYGEQEFTVHEIATFVDISNQLLADAAFNMEAELRADFAEEFGRIESAAFVNGDGVKKPFGLLTNAEIEVIEAAGASVSYDDFVDLYHALKGAYAANGIFAMNRTTIAKVRKLKDANGLPLWQSAMTAGNPSTIFGRPVLEVPEMPDEAAGATSIVFGDFRNFIIFDRNQLDVVRDGLTMRTEGQTRFHGSRRVGAGVRKAEAFKFLQIAA